jgi:hypothetical protein
MQAAVSGLTLVNGKDGDRLLYARPTAAAPGACDASRRGSNRNRTALAAWALRLRCGTVSS